MSAGSAVDADVARGPAHWIRLPYGPGSTPDVTVDVEDHP